MIVSRDLLPSTGRSSGIVMQKILAIKQEILMINKHEREHIVSYGETKQSERSYGFCQHQMVIHDRKETDQREKENKKQLGTLTEIKRLVHMSGKAGWENVPNK